MLRKTRDCDVVAVEDALASMRPQRNAAENAENNKRILEL